MEESVDVKALRARFHAKAEMAAVGGGGPPRTLLPGVGRAGTPMAFNSNVNGAVRPKASPTGPKPLPGVRSPSDLYRFPRPPTADPGGPTTVRNLSPLGVFPRPPPSHHIGSQEQRTASPGTEKPGRVKATGELLQNKMLRQLPGSDGTVPKPASPVITLLRSQRSMTEVPPLRRNLPPEGPRPLKPKRPPYVNLDNFRKAPAFTPMPRLPTPGKIHGGSSPSLPGSASPSGPPRLPAKPSSLHQQHSTVLDEDDQDTYDDIDVLPPPPPPPPKYPGSRDDSWTDHGSTQGDEESGESEIYEPIDEPEESSNPISKVKKKKDQLELKNKDQRVKQKKENEYRKKFKLTEPVEVLHIAKVRHDWQGGKNDLSVRQGDTIEIIRIKDNPGGKWLARTLSGTYGYINNTCVDLDYEEVKRSFLCKAADASFPPPPPAQDDDFYDDVGSSQQLNSTDLDNEDVYDDVQQIPDEFPPPPPEPSLDPKKAKKQEKEEKEFRKKFKFEGPITVICHMMVDPNNSVKKGGGKDLSLNRGEILEVIQFINDKKALCRNQQGKYGYVPRSVLLHMEGEIYDDVDSQAVVYDNDSSTDQKPWS
ncbi:FYN-binding protein 1 isoform X2 [Anguilla anguilla]|uniref:FYN-binding protein 1 isoform X2 n=1 Tax=Anguilla anguilla TaxID=7936 RepID=UPI0015ABC0DE|nr:FYN-binding protein 1 isoform X2 [Anguilla anguilla]